VLVKKGKDIGGDFKHIPACHSATQIGCVIAFSSFDQPVPTPSLFGGRAQCWGRRCRRASRCCAPIRRRSRRQRGRSVHHPEQPFDPKSILNTGIAILG